MIKKGIYFIFVLSLFLINGQICMANNLDKNNSEHVLFPNLKKVSKEFISIFRIDPLEKSASKAKDKILKSFYIRKKRFYYINGTEDLTYLNVLKKKRQYPVNDIVRLDKLYNEKDYLIDILRFEKTYFQNIKVFSVAGSEKFSNVIGIKIGGKGVNKKKILLVGGIDENEVDTTAVLMKFIDVVLQKMRLQKDWQGYNICDLLKNVDIIILPKVSLWKSSEKTCDKDVCKQIENNICNGCSRALLDGLLKKYNPDLTVFYDKVDGSISCNFIGEASCYNINDRILVKDLCKLTGYRSGNYKLEEKNNYIEKHIEDLLGKNLFLVSLNKNNGDINKSWLEIEKSFPYLLNYTKNIESRDFNFEPFPFKKSIILNH